MFADGWTITLDNMERFDPALAGLCRAAEYALPTRFQTNF